MKEFLLLECFLIDRAIIRSGTLLDIPFSLESSYEHDTIIFGKML